MSKAVTRGFLFADLRGYSAFTDRHGDRAAEELLRRFRAIVRAEIATHDGAEIRTEGDSFYVVFDSISDAVLAALAIQEAASRESLGPEATPLRIGIGVHAGEASDGDEGIVSSAVNVAARVCAVAEPGEVLVTDTVRSLTRTFLQAGFVPRGRRRLKGIAEPIQLYRVETSTTPSSRRTVLRPVGWPAAIGIAAVVALAVGIAIWTSVSSPSGATSPSPTDGASLGADPSPSRAAAADTFPNEAEAALLDRLPESIAGSCERADTAQAPVLVFPNIQSVVIRNEDGTVTRELREVGPPIEDTFEARFGLTCVTGVTRVVLWVAGRMGEAEELFFNALVRRSIDPGDCEEDGRAWESWESGMQSGNVMCFTAAEGVSVLEWNYPEEGIYAIATRRDGDATALRAWWRETGRQLGR